MKKIILLLLLSIIVVGCSQNETHDDPIPKHDNFTIASKFVNEKRVINVWTPPQYDGNTDSLPVLYMADGGIKEDFPHIANTLAKLIEAKKIRPIILVGIENTERGRDLTGASQTEADAQYCPLTDGAKNFRSFITDELIPEINKKYRCTNEKGLIGESLSGLFVMETFLLKPDSFDFYVAMDPSLWWNDHYLEKNAEKLLANLSKRNTKLWFAGSGAEDISVHTKNLAKTIRRNAPPSLQWQYSNEPNEEHNTIFRATKEKALTWSIGDK